MKEPLWQRLRRQREKSAAADDTPEDGESADESARPGDAERTSERDVLDTLRLLNRTPEPSTDASSAEAQAARTAASNRQAAYADWAERMKQKRAEKQATIRATTSADPGASPGGEGTYWSSDALYEESRRLESDLSRVVQTRMELLAVLGLPGTATEDDVQRQYRTLAKEHHPDRFPDADDSTRDWHAEQMHRINAAYRALQDVGA